MERYYVLAYRNSATGGEWIKIVRFTGPYARDNALRAFGELKGDFARSDLALFFYRAGQDWMTGHIRYAAWGWQGKPICGLGGLIGSLGPDWF